MKRSTLIITISLLALMAGLLGRQAWAGSLTAGLPIKLGAYQGVLTVASTPNAVLEIGNAHAVSGSIPQGQDIASDKDIYLRPGSVTQANSLRLTKYTRTDNGLNQNSVDLVLPTNGQLCLYNAGTKDCRSAWPNTGTGDSYWQVGDVGYVLNSHLLPNLATMPGGTDPAIRVGTAANPVPASAGRAVEVYGDTQLDGTIPVVLLQGGQLDTGYENEVDKCVGGPLVGQICDPASPSACSNQPFFCALDHWDIGGGALHVGGNLQIGNVPSDTPNFHLNSPANIRPFNHGMRYYGDPNSINGTGSGIDADTLDSDSYLPFTSQFCVGGPNDGAPCPNGNECASPGRCQKHDLFFKTVVNVGGTANYLCLKTNDTKLCVTGPSAGAPCVDSSTCNGGTCTSLCLSQQQTCPADPVQKHCASNPATSCTTNANCLPGDSCIRGRIVLQTTGDPSPTSCNNAASLCNTACLGVVRNGGTPPNFPANSGTNIVCEGQPASGSCSAFGSKVITDQATSVGCYPYCPGGCGTPTTYYVVCDCWLGTPKPYSCTPGAPGCPGAPGPTAGADLCTPLFQ